MQIVPGSAIAAELTTQLESQISKASRKPRLGIVLANNDDATQKFIELKVKKAKELGVPIFVAAFPEGCTKEQVANQIAEFAQDPDITGILLQLPLFPHLADHTNDLINVIPAKLDVDGLTAISQGRLAQQLASVTPATVRAIFSALEHIAQRDSNLPITQFLPGKHVVIVNHSNLIGKPLAAVLLNHNATVTVAHKHTTNLSQLTSQADILITATGQGGLIRSEMVKSDAIVIDGGAPTGDVRRDFELEEKVAWLTPVPGGIGPLTVVSLFANLWELHTQNTK